MKIVDILKSKKVTVSCELFPPKKDEDLVNYHKVVADMAKVSPSFISVTYGTARGVDTSKYTVDIANEIQNVNDVTALAHMTCVASSREKVERVLADLKAKKIENILALRGDLDKGQVIPEGHFRHASELAEFIKKNGDFCIGGACYPEGHPEAESLTSDIENLKYKIDAGVEFLTTQMFFDNDILYSYILKLMRAGINIPIVAGIMPVTNARQIKRICATSGTLLPRRFMAVVDRFGSNPQAMKQAGIAYATDQIIDLIANGVDHIHIYAMNKPEVAKGIMDNLSEIIGHDDK